MRGALKIVYFSATSSELESLSRAALEYERENKLPIEIIARSKTQLMEDRGVEDFIHHALHSHVTILCLHGGKGSCPGFDKIVKAISHGKLHRNRPYLHIHGGSGDPESLELSLQYSDLAGKGAWKRINTYLLYGGVINIKNLFLYLRELLWGEKDAPAPLKLPHEGIYHPDFSMPLSLSEYLEYKKISPTKPVVGIWFYQTYWLNQDLSHMDCIIQEVEDRGAHALCVFHLRYKDRERGNMGADEVAKNFFMRQGRPFIDVLISPMMFSLTLGDRSYEKIYPTLNVPVIQAIMCLSSFEQWEESESGLSPGEISFSVAQPEFDGNYITVPIATREEDYQDPITGALLTRYRPIPERVAHVVSLALNWAKLRRISKRKKKVAIIFHNYPPRDDRIGCAAGLDSFASVTLLLKKMKERGYYLEHDYKDAQELARALTSSLTYDRRWILPEDIKSRASISIGTQKVKEWVESLPPLCGEKLQQDWGEAPGELFTSNHEMFFPGIVNGNIFLTIQPPRGYFENIEKIYHDPYLSPPYNYISHYRWIKEIFRADAVIHVGKHGSLEWLPGKGVGLSRRCWPDISISDLPNIYPYIINDPSEGTQAKRRSYCCIIDHLTPIFTNAGLHDELARLDNLLREYTHAQTEDRSKLPILKEMIWKATKEANLDSDLNLTQQPEDFDEFLHRLHSYLGELSHNMINKGLHILGSPPQGEDLVEYLFQLTRLPNGDVPSLLGGIIEAWGFDYEEMIREQGKIIDNKRHLRARDIIDRARDKGREIIREIQQNQFNKEKIKEIVHGHFPQGAPTIMACLRYICDLSITLSLVENEIDNTLRALDGMFVPPGPSGAPTRGQAHILPTGRNFYSLDPRKIPTPAAWEMGKKLGDKLIERYLRDTGRYPDTIGIIIWGGSTMRTGGDDIAEVLYLLGVRPVWNRYSMDITGLEIIPLSELKRPRLDVVPRISGFFRDAFPGLIELMDRAIKMVACLQEGKDENLIRRNVERDMAEYLEQGMEREEALRKATLRVFGCPPGTYGAGVAELVETGKWKEQKDLAEVYIFYSSHAYGEKVYGKNMPDEFKKVLSRMELTIKNEDSREYDIMSCTDYYNYYGGLITAATTLRGKKPLSYVGDSSNPNNINIRSISEETKFILRSRITNPKWIEGMQKHGYKGAGDISKMIDVIFGWDATSDVIEDWMYEEVAHKIALDKKNQEWMKKNNPHALHNIVSKLLEAISRGMWKPQKDTYKKLKMTFLEIEGDIEELMDNSS